MQWKVERSSLLGGEGGASGFVLTTVGGLERNLGGDFIQPLATPLIPWLLDAEFGRNDFRITEKAQLSDNLL